MSIGGLHWLLYELCPYSVTTTHCITIIIVTTTVSYEVALLMLRWCIGATSYLLASVAATFIAISATTGGVGVIIGASRQTTVVQGWLL